MRQAHGSDAFEISWYYILGKAQFIVGWGRGLLTSAGQFLVEEYSSQGMLYSLEYNNFYPEGTTIGHRHSALADNMS